MWCVQGEEDEKVSNVGGHVTINVVTMVTKLMVTLTTMIRNRFLDGASFFSFPKETEYIGGLLAILFIIFDIILFQSFSQRTQEKGEWLHRVRPDNN